MGLIEHFNRVACPVEANEAVFVVVTFQFSRKDSGFKGIPNVLLGNTVFKSRRREDDIRLHISLCYLKIGAETTGGTKRKFESSSGLIKKAEKP
jgi:hypothetical protein